MSALPPILDVPAVLARYALRDRRSARRLMDDAGAFSVAGRLVVREDDLEAWERRAQDARRAPQRAQDAPPAPRRARRSSAAARARLETPDWWRDEGEGG